MRVAVVTGGANGIGRGIAERLAVDRQVVILDRDQTALDTAVAAIGRDARGYRCDVADATAIEATIATVIADLGGIDILVNNAGICPAHAGGAQPVEAIELDEWQRVLAVNLTGAFLCSRAVIPVMKASGWGRIVNVTSMGGRTRSLLSGAHYAASKAGLIGFTRILAGQLGPHGITSNCIAPGRVDTDQSRSFGTSGSFVAQLPAGRLGEVADIAAGVAYLVSEEASYVTGAILDVNGGHFMP